MKETAQCARAPRPTREQLLEALGETLEARQARIRKLYEHFAGEAKAIDGAALEAGFESLAIPTNSKYAGELLAVADSNEDGLLDYSEFQRYLDDKETELLRLFWEVDASKDGTIWPAELDAALHRAGIEISSQELAQFVEVIDADKNGRISFSEWRDFFLLLPHQINVGSLYHYWHDVVQIDIGEVAVVPQGASDARLLGRYTDAWKYLLAGAVAGVASRTATAPLDRIKVLMQVQRELQVGAKIVAAGLGAAALTAVQRGGIMGGIRKIYAQEGVVGFFRGNGINVVKIAPESAIKFMSFEYLKPLVAAMGGWGLQNPPREGSCDPPKISPGGRLVAGGIAGMIAQASIYPLEVVKTRLQIAAPPSPGAPRANLARITAQIYAQGGVHTFFRGLGASLLGMFPYAGIDLMTYESLKDLSRKLNRADPGPLTQLACGTVSGAFAATLVYPLALVRTRLQASYKGDANGYKGITDCCMKILRQEGPRAFYKGLAPNLMKVVPAASITYVIYEDLKVRLAIH